MKVFFYLLSWHLQQSDAFDEILINFIRSKFLIEKIAWDGKEIRPEWKSKSDDLFVFCQKKPTTAVFKNNSYAKVIWVPMWNNVAKMVHHEWKNVDKRIKILAFSPLVAKFSNSVGLKTLLVSYAPNPKSLIPCDWTDGNKIFYWNRVGIISKDNLLDLCQKLKVNTLFFRPDIDPKIDTKHFYDFDETSINGMKIVKVPFIKEKNDLEKKIYLSNIFLAPRPSEGVGVTFLEAMGRGQAVLAINNPTMTDYIQNYETGVILNSSENTNEPNVMLKSKISINQDWDTIQNLNLQSIGKNAQNLIEKKYYAFNDTKVKIIEFMTHFTSAEKPMRPYVQYIKNIFKL